MVIWIRGMREPRKETSTTGAGSRGRASALPRVGAVKWTFLPRSWYATEEYGRKANCVQASASSTVRTVGAMALPLDENVAAMATGSLL